jgi:hypothetical protein
LETKPQELEPISTLAVRNNTHSSSSIYHYKICLEPPGLLKRTTRCIVYYDQYIDCTVRAPTMVDAINNRLACDFRFHEPRP